MTTYYQQIQTGVADGVITILTGAAPNRLHEVAPYITLVGIGSQVTGALAINLDTWNRLPDDVRAVLEELGPEYSRGSRRRHRAALRARASQRMRSEGATVTEFPLAEKQKWLAAMPDIASRWIEATERRGIPAGEALRAYMNADARARRQAAARLGSPASPTLADESMQASNARAPQLFATLVGVLNAAGVVWVFALMFLICADITARTVFDDPIAGVTEMVSLSLVACVFLQLAHAVLHGRLMRVEMFLDAARAAPPRRRERVATCCSPCSESAFC